MIFTFIAERCSDLPVTACCRAMKMTTSGFYEWRDRQSNLCARAREDHALTAGIIEIHRQSRGTYGAPRVHAELRLGAGINVGRKRVAPLMRSPGSKACIDVASEAVRDGIPKLSLPTTS
jgi:putative transposase